MPYAYLWGNNHSTMYYNAGTFLQIGFPSGIDIRIKTIECGISAGKNYSAVATTIKTEDGEHLYFKSGNNAISIEQIMNTQKVKYTGNIMEDFFNNMRIYNNETPQ